MILENIILLEALEKKHPEARSREAVLAKEILFYSSAEAGFLLAAIRKLSW